MSFKELLKAQGLNDEQIEALHSAMKESKVRVSEGEEPAASEKNPQDDRKTKENEGSKEKDAEIQKLKETVNKTRIEAQLIRELTMAGARDVDYLMYKLEKSGSIEKLTLSEDGKVPDVDKVLESMKADYSSQFTHEPQSGIPEDAKKYDVKALEGGSSNQPKGPVSLEEAIAQHYVEK